MSVASSGEPGYNQNTNHPVSSETPGLTVQSPGDLQKLQLLLSVLPVMALVLPVVVTCFGASTGSRAPVAGDYPPVPKQNSPTLCRRLESSLSADRHLGVDASEHRAEAILVIAIQLVQEGGTGCQEIPSMAEVQHTLTGIIEATSRSYFIIMAHRPMLCSKATELLRSLLNIPFLHA